MAPDTASRLDDPPGKSGATATAEWVAEVLRDRIVKGELPPGSRLVERSISAELAVSRTPVREALKLLRMDGLIDISRHRGAQVLTYTAQEARDLFELIAALESIAAERLCRRLGEPLLDRLEELHAAMLTYHKIGNQADYFDTNSLIHDLIVGECGNPVIQETHHRLMARARRGRFLAIMAPDRLTQAVMEHETLMEALRRRDAPACAAIWQRHLRHTGETLAEVLSQAD